MLYCARLCDAIAILVFVLRPVALAQPAAFAQPHVFFTKTEIQGNTKVPVSLIRECIQSKPKELVDMDTVDSDIKRIYHIGCFRMVQAYFKNQNPQKNTAVLVYEVQERAGNLSSICSGANPSP